MADKGNNSSNKKRAPLKKDNNKSRDKSTFIKEDVDVTIETTGSTGPRKQEKNSKK